MATKTEIVIRIMKANSGKPMAEVLPLLEKEFGWTEKNARAAYALRVKADPTLGVLEIKPRAARASAPKAPKLIKAKPVILKDKPKVTDKTVEELADIRAKNLARLKAVGRKYAKGRQAEPRVSDEPFDSDAVPNLESELDSLKVPAFLTKDQVKALV